MTTLNFKKVLTTSIATLTLVFLAASVRAQATVGGTDINSDPVPSIDAGTGDQIGLENVVTVTGTYGGNDYSNDAFENVDVVTADPALAVTKTASISTGAQAGDIITYTYEITNTGNVVLAGVTIDDQHDSASGTAGLDVNNCIVTTDATITSGTSTLNAGDTVIVAGSAASDTFTTFGPSDVAQCTSTYTVTQADVDQLQ